MVRTLGEVKRDLRVMYHNLHALRPLLHGPEGQGVRMYLLREVRAVERELEHRLMLRH